MKKKITTVLFGLFLCFAPLALLFLSMIVSFVVLLLSSGTLLIDFEIIGIVLMLINPLYQVIVNYRFISKKNAFFIWLFLVFLQTPWYFPIIFRENNEWLGIGILISYIGNYQIIGITISFAIACLVKYLVYRRKAKKALGKAPVSEDDGTETNFDC